MARLGDFASARSNGVEGNGKEMIVSSYPGTIAAGATEPYCIRTASKDDVGRLCDHFAALSPSARYSRFMGAVNNFAKIASDCLRDARQPDRFTFVAESLRPECGGIVAEASYAFDTERRRGEFAISVADGCQRQGLGSALLCALQFRAISLGHIELFGEALKTNEQMRNLARKAGFGFSRSPDWRAVRFEKTLVSRTAPSRPDQGLPVEPEAGR
jgi:GNAT superfamily N-acetyltransferase